MRKIKKLLEPIKIADMEVKNRFFMSPMGNSLGERDCMAGDRIIAYFAERAKGGVGLIDVVCFYEDFGYSMPLGLSLNGAKYLPGLKRLTDAIHVYGTKVFAQLMHQGSSAPSVWLGHQAVSASEVRSGLTGEVPRALTIDEIKQTIENLAEGAYWAKEGGFDGVEAIAQGGYLINQFLSPVTNKRTDEYGGDLEGRIRFPVELIKRIRERVGPGYPISLRICGDDFMPGGNRQEDIKAIVQIMEKVGVDVINVAAGWHQCHVPLITMGVPRGHYVYLAQGIKEVVGVPVISAHRNNDPFLAEQALLDHRADMISMGRPLLADPELPNKVAEGRFKEIRMCIACNNCFPAGEMMDGLIPECAINAAVGREKERQLVPAKKRKKVIVVGAGPGGLEAARVLAIRGHKVILYEREERLGGQLNLAAIPPERGEQASLLDYFSNEMERLGVDVRMGKEASAKLLRQQKPDAIVVATGGTPIRPDIPGIDGDNVVYAAEVLEEKVELGKNVVVIGGGSVGAETGLYIARKGTITPESAVFLATKGAMDAESAIALTLRGNKKVTILEMLGRIAEDMNRSTRWTYIQSLQTQPNLEMITKAKAVRITDAGVVYNQQGEEKLIEADTVVIAVGTKPENSLVEAVKGLAKETYAVGDCVEARMIRDAIHEGYDVGRMI
ncbi:MAG: FAD-dependent oxidoreductase [Deltaproteobacteria bacterium]|nr:FAD-dependent oxidoreductase [Deltaproteobacteria bacterium]